MAGADLAEFEQAVRGLRQHPTLKPRVRKGVIEFVGLSLQELNELLRNDAAYYFLLAASGLNRSSLKRAASTPEAKIVIASDRRSHAFRSSLPPRMPFEDVVKAAILLRRSDLNRRERGGIEQLFRERLKSEGIPILMSPPVRQVPGILISRRKPDGVFPDPAADLAPVVYLEIKNVKRVADDIQKRLYEVAEAAIEMKFLYGDLSISGMQMKSTREVEGSASLLREELRKRILASKPAVVVLMLCPKAEAEKYRAGAEAFVDRVFFQEEIDECLAFLRQAVNAVSSA
jgi:hypothetical protein